MSEPAPDTPPPLQEHPFEHEIRVGYAETDMMGFLHHSRFPVHMETARTEMLRATGLSYKEWEEQGLLLPLTDYSLTFHKPAYYDDLILIRIWLVEMTRLRLRFHYEFHCRERNVHLASGWTGHVFMTPSGRPTRAPEGALEHLKAFL